MDNSRGSKIKAYRSRSKLSQMSMEMDVGLSAGVASRIENNHINPTKETLSKIAKVLNLSPMETADLLLDDLGIFSDIFESINNLYDLEYQDFYQEICQLFDKKLCIFGSVLLIMKGDKLCAVASTNNSLKAKITKLLGKDVSQFYIQKDSYEERNIIYKSILEKRVIESDSMNAATVNAIPSVVSTSISKLIGFKQGVSIPFRYRSLQGAIYCISTDTKINQHKIDLLRPVIDLIARIIYWKKF